MSEIALEKRVLECQALGCGNLIPTQRVKLVRVFLAEERKAARMRQLAGTRLAENVRKGQRGPTAWERIGARLGVSGRTARKEWEVWTAAQQDPRLQYLVRWMDARGVDGPWRRLQQINVGRPMAESVTGQLVPKSKWLDSYTLDDELWYIKYDMERLAEKIDSALYGSPAQTNRMLRDLLGTVCRIVWGTMVWRTAADPKPGRRVLTPEELKAMLVHYVDLMVAWDQPAVRAARRKREWENRFADERPWRDLPPRRALRRRAPEPSVDMEADLALAGRLAAADEAKKGATTT